MQVLGAVLQGCDLQSRQAHKTSQVNLKIQAELTVSETCITQTVFCPTIKYFDDCMPPGLAA